MSAEGKRTPAAEASLLRRRRPGDSGDARRSTVVSSLLRCWRILALLAVVVKRRAGAFHPALTRDGHAVGRQDPSCSFTSKIRIARASWSGRLRSAPAGSDRPYHRRKRRRMPSGESVERRRKPRLGLLTFDLDDTLFPTELVIRHANQRMVEFLNAVAGCNTTVEDYLSAARAIREQWDERQGGRVASANNDRDSDSDDDEDYSSIMDGSEARPREEDPISYTELRKLAIKAELERYSNDNSPHRTSSLDDLVKEAYELWEHERHAAAEYYLPPVVVEALHSIRRHFGEHLCVAAVTNGRGNPLKMPSLAPYFAFCVSGEDDGVFPYRKPHPKIFQVALDKFRQEYYPPADDDAAAISDDDESLIAAVEGSSADDFLWCNVGDCLANDVGASADCGAFAVWYCPDPGRVASAMAGIGGRGNGRSDSDDDEDNNSAGGGGGGLAEFVASLLALENGQFEEPPPQPESKAAQRQPELRPGWSTATRGEVERRSELASQAAAQEKVSAHIYHLSQLLDVLKQVARPDRRAKMQRRRR